MTMVARASNHVHAGLYRAPSASSIVSSANSALGLQSSNGSNSNATSPALDSSSSHGSPTQMQASFYSSSSSNIGVQHQQRPEVVTGPDGELIVVEHVVALHDFQSNNPTCLSFQAGQIIRVFNRDQSGWWDGELEGRRGWFPSNYVDQDGEAGEYEDEDAGAHGAMSLADEAENGTYRRPYQSRKMMHTSSLQESNSSYSILDPILHAISLLHSAVRANRVAHFQPSTACVISSVRSVLSATDCLTRESPVLRAHPSLARERKQILSVLSRLVTQARKASAPLVDEGRRGHEMESMLRHAEMVLANVKSFLDVAVECGLQIPDRHSSAYDELYSAASEASSPRENDKTPTPESGRRSKAGAVGAGGLAARSMVNLRSPTEHTSSSLIPNGVPTAYMDRTDSQSEARGARRADPSTSQNSVHSSTPSQGSSSAEAPVAVERTASEVLQRLSVANDQLLSVIAAFIGHVHTHTRESHASSFAHLIDMTREAVDAVRGVLVVVEAVHANADLQANKAREMSILFETRESLYEATTALVTAARIITGSPNTQARNAEDEEKSNLLQAATGVLRTGGECVGAVKLCIDKHDTVIRISIPELVGSAKIRQEEDDAAEDLASDNYATIRRGKNTLSYLGRKATSLNCLRDQYGAEASKSSAADGGEAITESEAELSSDDQNQVSPMQAQNARFPKSSSNLELARGRNGSSGQDDHHLEVLASARLRSSSVVSPRKMMVNSRQDSSSDQNSDESEAMSRDHSRMSGSSALSHQSATTAETSARPSIDRRESDPYKIDQAVPHTAPAITGPAARFPRDAPPPSAIRTKDLRLTQPSSETNSPVLEHMNGRMRSGTIDSTAAWSDSHDQPSWMGPQFDSSDIAFNADKQIIGATLPALVEKLTPHDTTVDGNFANTFSMCFRQFTTPQELFDTMIRRYNLPSPANVNLIEEEQKLWEQRKVLPVRLRVVNFLKNWLEVHWQPASDAVVLEQILNFAEAQEQPALQRAATKLKDLAQRRMSAGASTKVQMMMANTRGAGSLTRVISADQAKRDGTLGPLTELAAMYSSSVFSKAGPTPPAPIMSKNLLTHLRVQPASAINVTDFDSLELARQLTIMESKLYCAILPEELLGQEFSKKAGVSNAVHVKGMSSLSTHLTGWISECILSEEDARKRRDLLKFFIKLADRCFTLNNFNSLMAINCALQSSTITRLTKTWEGLSAKYKVMADQQRAAVEHTRNFAEYRQRLRQTFPPALPFVGLFLTDLTFCHEGNAPTRISPLDPQKKLINFDRYSKVNRIIGDLQRYQVPYNLVEVPEVQTYLRNVLSAVKGGGGGNAAEELYRRSLLLEPRGSDQPTTPSTNSALAGAKDIFNWKS